LSIAYQYSESTGSTKTLYNIPITLPSGGFGYSSYTITAGLDKLTPSTTPAPTSSATTQTTSHTPVPTETTSASSNGLSTGVQAGIGVGISLLILLNIAVLAWLLLRRRRRSKRRSGSELTETKPQLAGREIVPSEADSRAVPELDATYAKHVSSEVHEADDKSAVEERPRTPQELEGSEVKLGRRPELGGGGEKDGGGGAAASTRVEADGSLKSG
jgi:hypothetical protein